MDVKIAYDQQIFRRQNYGGISRYFCEIASRIAQDPDVQVSITAPMHINGYLEHLPPGIVSGFRAPRLNRLNTQYVRLASKGMGILLGDLMLRRGSPDILHETYYSSRRHGPKRAQRVLTIYDMIHEKFASNFHPQDKTAHNKTLAAERADHVICISECTRRDAIEILRLPPDKTSVIHLGFDLMNAAEAPAQESVTPVNKPFLLYVGTRGGHKNFSRLLEAYATSMQLKAEFDLVCFGGGAFQADEVTMIRALGLEQHQVTQLGGSDRLLANLYKGASAFIYPSLYEGFGIPPLEAMAYSCPVVCSNRSSIPEVVGDAGEYFEPSDIESMRKAVERVVGSYSRREQLIEQGHIRLKAFSWDRCATETLDIYKTLI